MQNNHYATSETGGAFLYFTLCFILSTAIAFPLSIFGGMADSLLYFGQAQLLWDDGLLDGIIAITGQTGKLELILPILFYLEKPLKLQEFGFILLNGALVNLAVAHTAIILSKNISNKSTSIYGIFAILFSYIIYSNTLYIWRSIFSVYLLILAVTNSKAAWKIAFLVLGCLMHLSTVIFYGIYLFCTLKFIPKNKSLFFIFSILVATAINIGFQYMQFLSAFVSTEGGMEVFTGTQGNLAIRIIINLYLIFLAAIYTQNLDNKVETSLWRFCTIIVISSTAMADNWHLSWRIAAPAMVILPCLIFSSARQKRNKLAKLSIYLSILPSIRLIYLFFTGEFGG
ncbi:hypothetical protein [Vogesella indigofera]|uniref:EpsG-like glucosyltransferase n=1 Tax=Vogesella indigofera TaxID=45465 RepID=A0ABT5I0H4_VOGIN|nr:hypothetical protein [Vogesella indigofera]MDC7689658.1 hypothetical protein [Vogesella indigofera]